MNIIYILITIAIRLVTLEASMRSYHYEDVMHSIYGVSYAVDGSAGTDTMEA